MHSFIQMPLAASQEDAFMDGLLFEVQKDILVIKTLETHVMNASRGEGDTVMASAVFRPWCKAASWVWP